MTKKETIKATKSVWPQAGKNLGKAFSELAQAITDFSKVCERICEEVKRERK